MDLEAIQSYFPLITVHYARKLIVMKMVAIHRLPLALRLCQNQ